MFTKSHTLVCLLALAWSPSVLPGSERSQPTGSTEVLTDIPLDSHAGTDAAAESAADLAKKLANPIANLISIPIQSNMDFGVGPDKGMVWYTNIQPVIPFELSEDWIVITRTILPVVYQEGLVKGGAADTAGLSDIVQSFFFSPKESPITWGVGPVFLWPTATNNILGSGQFGVGPTLVVLKQAGPWTVGFLGNQLWGYAEISGRQGDEDQVNALFLEPFVSYTTPTQTTIGLNTESVYDWTAKQWTVPINFQVSQLLKVGGVPLQIFAGVRYFAEKPEYGPDWGIRFGVTLLFPK